MLIKAILWKFPEAKNLEAGFVPELGREILRRFPENLPGVDYVEQDIPDFVADEDEQTFTKKLLPSTANQDAWIAEYKIKRLPMVEWIRKMRASDRTLMDRNTEILIQEKGGKVNDPELQKKYDKKISLRKEKPVIT